MNQSLIETVRHTMAQRSTDELLEIWQAGDQDEYTSEAFEAVRMVLTQRLGTELPPFGRPASPAATSSAVQLPNQAASQSEVRDTSPDCCPDCGSTKFTRSPRRINIQNGKLIKGSMGFIGGITLLVFGIFAMFDAIVFSIQLGSSQAFLLFAAFGVVLLLGGRSLVTRHMSAMPVTLRVCNACSSDWLTTPPGSPQVDAAHACPECHSCQVAAGQRRIDPKTLQPLTVGSQLLAMLLRALFGSSFLLQALFTFLNGENFLALLYAIDPAELAPAPPIRNRWKKSTLARHLSL